MNNDEPRDSFLLDGAILPRIERIIKTLLEKQKDKAKRRSCLPPIEPEWAELLAAACDWAETMDGDRPPYSYQARRLYRAVAALREADGG